MKSTYRHVSMWIALLCLAGCSTTDGSNGNSNGNVNQNDNGLPTTNQNDNQNTNNNGNIATRPVIADHTSADNFDGIPDGIIQQIHSNYRIFYGHTSHGSQIITGMNMIAALDTRFASSRRSPSVYMQDDDTIDLGHEGDLAWEEYTRTLLNADSTINMVMWSWCGGVSDNTEEGINTYLQALNQLEQDYPNVTFIYMTGHLDGTGIDGNLNIRNEQIRNYCRNNNKILFDFADIESYDPNGNFYPDDSDACAWCTTWCEAHSCPAADCSNESENCAHSHCFNCYRKGRAFWWMMARIAGWTG